MGDILSFCCFSMKPAVAGRILRAVTMIVGTWDSVCRCDSKNSHGRALFWCPEEYGFIGVGDELEVVEGAGGCEMTSLRVG